MDQRPRFDAKYHVGIEQVDNEHRQLFEIAGRVYDALGEKGAAADGIARAAIAELLDYTTTHFANEEALMDAAAYPELAAHRGLHRHLLSRARDMEMRMEFDAQYVPLELNRFIASWLVEHIQDSDRRFGDFVANFHVGNCPAPLMMKDTAGVPSRCAEVAKTFEGNDRES